MKKTYPLNQSPLFKITSKKKLALVLGVDLSTQKSLLLSNSFQGFETQAGRAIQYPIGDLIPIHRKLGLLFSSIEVPEFLTSQKGSSYVKNAGVHKGNIPVIKTDISKFYPSVGFGFILRMFIEDFKCAKDVAWILAKLCSYNGVHLPTGSKISGYVAYFANRKMFDEIDKLANLNQCNMTCYVDDIVISGAAANKKLLVQIRRIVLRHGLVTKDEKSRCYTANSIKKITGCIVRADKLLLPNIRHMKMSIIRRQLTAEKNPIVRRELDKKLKGRAEEAIQILQPRT